MSRTRARGFTTLLGNIPSGNANFRSRHLNGLCAREITSAQQNCQFDLELRFQLLVCETTRISVLGSFSLTESSGGHRTPHAALAPHCRSQAHAERPTDAERSKWHTNRQSNGSETAQAVLKIESNHLRLGPPIKSRRLKTTAFRFRNFSIPIVFNFQKT